MRVGVIGVGRIGAFHARCLSDHPEVGNLLIHDIDSAKAGRVAAACNGELRDRQELFRRTDALVIATDTASHVGIIEEAVAAGLPVFCEKPIALDLESTTRIVNTVAREHGTLQIGFQRRFDAGYRRAREAVQNGTLGTLYIVRVAGHDAAPPHETYIPTSGGIFRDLSIHDFDIVRYVTGQEIVEVYADGSVVGYEMFAAYGDVDTAVATLRLSSGALGIISAARHDPRGYDIRMELFGSGDTVAVGMGERMPLRSLEDDGSTPGAAWRSFLDRFETAYRAELHAFVDLVAGRIGNPCPPEEALVAMRVALACDRSLREHRPVRVDEIN